MIFRIEYIIIYDLICLQLFLFVRNVIFFFSRVYVDLKLVSFYVLEEKVGKG